MLPILPVWVKPLAIAACMIVSLAACVGLGYRLGAAAVTVDLKAEQAAHAADVAAAQEDGRKAERAAEAALYAQAAKLAEVENHAKVETDSLRADLRSSRVRLSIPVAAACPASSGGDTGAAAQPGAEARAELMPQTADDLVAIAVDGDSAVRQLNALIDAYDTLRDQYNDMVLTVRALDH